MSLSDELNEEAGRLDRLTDYPAANQGDEPPKITPVTEFDGSSGYIQTTWMPSETPPVHREILEKFGYDPERVRIVDQPLIKRWEFGYTTEELVDNGAGKLVKVRTGSETKWLASYRFKIEPVGAASFTDIEAIVLRARAEKRPTTGAHWMVFQAGDQQLGKRSRDGSTEEIVDRYIRSVEAAAEEFKELRRFGVEGIQISLPGDCLEGVVSQKSANMWLTQETIAEQTRILRRLLMYTVEQFAPLANQVYLDTVNGNHDQSQRMQNTYPGDGWATECAISVSDALKLNPSAFSHVEVRVPDKWSGNMTVPVGDTVVTVVHGHQWSRSIGPMKWWADQAVNNQPAGGAQLLQHGHWHEFQTRSNAHRIAIGSPTFDCGSDWYREKTGATSKRGGLVYLLRSGEVSRLTLV